MDGLITSISNIIIDYAAGEFGQLDEAHVRRWIAQFDEDDQEVILAETNRILKRTYITKDKFTAFISGLVSSKKFTGNDSRDFWSQVSLCDIQINGHSQRELVTLLSNTVFEQFEIRPNINQDSEHHIYVDDFLFSGDRIKNDLKVWIRDTAPEKFNLSIVLMGFYRLGYWKVKQELENFAKSLNKNMTLDVWSIENLRLENRLFNKNISHIFWPDESIMQIPSVNAYINEQECTPQFRVVNNLKNNIFSVDRRTQYEHAMTKAGIKIRGYCREPSRIMKPLGYSTFKGFGFGGTVFSYRNCPNNAPLAFWWGNPKYPDADHPFRQWYPLMQRKTYD
ncbi:hypothetical protein C1N32_16870 [Vibrio diazotrophicus]|uniref:PRTase-CE domain-containing protein n=1 Tax=Vibrio diazotrophicus TaxID=685 RepID=A0A2J8HYC7_VIBDI|nr:hypothetical protein [Vibrio diazotrophicus]PNI03273.1 hypothetical protein C1N32_16870 [Vibrio diazotrophicus]